MHSFPLLRRQKLFFIESVRMDDDELDVSTLKSWINEASTIATGRTTAAVDAFENVHRAVQTNVLRDLDLDDGIYQQIFRLLLSAIKSDNPSAPSLASKAFTVAIGAFSTREFVAEHAECLGQLVDEDAVDVLLAYMKSASEAAVRAQIKASDTMGGVTFASSSASDAAQPASGKLSDLRGSGSASTSEAHKATPAADMLRRSAAAAAKRKERDPSADVMACARAMLYWLWVHNPPRRPHVERRLVAFFDAYAAEPTREASAAVRSVLQIVHAILQPRDAGLAEDVSDDAAQKWLPSLLRLYHTPGMMSETLPLLGAFHESLVQCLFDLVETAKSRGVPHTRQVQQDIITGVAGAWPPLVSGTSLKAVLLIHELDQLLGALLPPGGGAADAGHSAAVLAPVIPLVTESLASDNSRQAQMALAMFKRPGLAAAVCRDAATLKDVLQSLYRHGQPHWNATVNKQTHTVILLLAETVPEAFTSAVEQLWGAGSSDGLAKTLSSNISALIADSADPVRSTHEASVGGSSDGAARRDAAGFAIPAPRAPKVPKVATTAYASSSSSSASAGHNTTVNGAATAAGIAGRSLLPLVPDALASHAHSHYHGLGATGGQPPVTITGVAPWAFQPAAVPRFNPAASGGSRGANPPVTITGVAPWAQQNQNQAQDKLAAILARKTAPPPAPAHAPAAVSSPTVIGAGASDDIELEAQLEREALTDPRDAEDSRQAAELPAALRSGTSAVRFLRHYLRAIAPPASSTSAAAIAASTEPPPDVLARVPVLLPSLAFHDLVFGRELGAGTFSVVRHALRIVRGAPQASWPQYAVKVVSTAVMAELGYGAAVRREVAVLARLAHPNVARLVSAFRWRDGVHLVLEYAPRGDLHTTLTALGSLDEASTRFLAAEVAAALAAVHAAGFAFGDVKPENIVLVEDARGGVHAKLTDFGACRPINAEGFKLLADSTHILENLRDGDWRAAAGLVEQKPQSGAEPSVPSSAGSDSMDVEGPGQAEDTDMDQSDDNEDAEDERIEGTEEYLSPELASRAGRPSVASDAYALGITIYQCLTGRLPDTALIWPPPDNAGSGSGRRVRFGGGSAEAAFPSDFPAAAAELVKAMLHPDPAQRLGGGVRGILEVLDHPWFASALGPADDVVGTLHSRPGPSIAAGTAGPTADPAWSRRHNSTIWAPLPKQYSVSGSDPAAGAGAVAARPSKAAESFTLRELVAVEILPIIGVDKSAKP